MSQPSPEVSVTDQVPALPSAVHEASRYRRILDSLVDMVFCKSPAYQVTFANRATQEYYGATEDQLNGITDVPYNQLDFTAQYLRDDREVFETGRPVVRPDEPNVARDGSVRYFHTVKAPIRDDAGRIIEIVGVARDVTEERLQRAEAELSRTHLQLALEAGRMGSWEWDIERQRVSWSPQEERLYGMPEGSFSGTVEDYLRRIHPDDRASAWQAVEQALAVRSPTHHVLHRIVTPEGDVRWLDSHGRFLYAADGRPLRLVGISIDVTGRMVAQEELRRQAASMAASREELLRLFDQVPALISVTQTATQRITYQNARSRALLGGRDIVGMRATEVFPDADLARFMTIQQRVSESGQPYVGEEVELRLDLDGDGVAEEHYFNFVYQPLRDATGAIDSVMTFAVEVTDQVHARRIVEAKADELSRLTRALEESNRDLDQFAYVASHDLKAPLRGIANLAQWIEEDAGDTLPGDSREHLALLKTRVQRMEALIDGVLTYSRASRTREQPQRVDTDALVRDVVELLAPSSAARVQVESLPVIHTERVPLQQVFLNLLSNAVKHARGAAVEIRVSSRHAGAFVEFSVADNGPGIAPEFQERIWGVFQTLQSRDEVEGTGIGLAVVRKLVEARGGTVGVRSVPGAGATFHFTWPVRAHTT